MALIGLIGGVALVTIATLWALVKLVRLGLSDENRRPWAFIDHISRFYQLFLVLVGLYLFGPAIGSWLYDVAGVVEGLL